MAVLQIDGGSSLINILHGLGHSTSHSSVLRHDTALAETSQIEAQELPKHVIPHQMATVVIDNADFGEETKEQTHIMNMILLQNPSPTHDTRIQTTPLKRSLRKAVSAPLIEIDEYSMKKKGFNSFRTPECFSLRIINCTKAIWTSSSGRLRLHNDHVLQCHTNHARSDRIQHKTFRTMCHNQHNVPSNQRCISH